MGFLFHNAAKALGQQGWIDPAADAVERAVEGAYGAGGALVTVPLGAWTVTSMLDALDGFGNGGGLAPGADASLTVGLVSATGAALAGLTDWKDTDAEAKRVGAVHGILNLGIAAVYLVSLLARRRGARRQGVLLALLGFAASQFAAYLGGHLVDAERVGVTHAPREAPPAEFTPVLAEGELREGEPRLAQAGDVAVLLVREGGRVHALAEACSHMGGPLSDGRVEDGSIICPWHGSRFALESGRVLDGPATVPQPCYEARINGNQIEVRGRQPEAQYNRAE